MDKKLLRIIDANFNRVKEGLRVCEDICRFVDNHAALAKQLKSIRHDVTKAALPLGFAKLIEARDIAHDVGRASSASEMKRLSSKDIFWANAQRVKESLRVLEETAKLIDPSVAQSFKLLRYRFYDFEQKAIAQR